MCSKTQISFSLILPGSALPPVSLQLPQRPNFTSKETKKIKFDWQNEFFKNAV